MRSSGNCDACHGNLGLWKSSLILRSKEREGNWKGDYAAKSPLPEPHVPERLDLPEREIFARAGVQKNEIALTKGGGNTARREWVLEGIALSRAGVRGERQWFKVAALGKRPPQHAGK